MATGSLDTTQKLQFTIAPKDAAGADKPVEALEGVALNGADLTFEINPDNLGGFVVSGAQIGAMQIELRADSRIGEGEVVISEIHDIIVTSPEASTLGGTFGAVQPK